MQNTIRVDHQSELNSLEGDTKMRITSNLVHFISIFLVGESIQVPIKASIVLQRHAKESSGFRGKSGMESKEIVLKHQIKENANFIGLNTIPCKELDYQSGLLQIQFIFLLF